MSDNATSIKSKIPPKAPPHALILDEDTSFMVGTSLRSWKAGVVITEPGDIALLTHLPGKRFELIARAPTC